MGLYNITKNESENSIAIWKIEETLVELEALAFVPNDQKEIYTHLKTSRRKKEWLTVRILSEILQPEQKPILTYEPSGKPVLNGNYNISISHSNDFVVVLINANNAVGIDIQTPKKNIEKAITLFMSPTEQDELGKVNLFHKLHLYWCAKETLYKLVGDNSLNIYTHFSLYPFQINENNTLIGKILNDQKDIPLHYEITEDYYLVYTTHQ